MWICMCVCVCTHTCVHVCPIGSASSMLLLLILCLNPDWYKELYPKAWLYGRVFQTPRLEMETLWKRSLRTPLSDCHGSEGWLRTHCWTDGLPTSQYCPLHSWGGSWGSGSPALLGSWKRSWLWLLQKRPLAIPSAAPGGVWEKEQTRLHFSSRPMTYIRCRWHLG